LLWLLLSISGRNNRYRYYSYHNYCQRIGFVQEYRAEKKCDGLKDVIPDETRVLRAETIAIATDELVPGDVVLLEAGNRIP
jgi:magnesium-transporting ATPase (P-type)